MPDEIRISPGNLEWPAQLNTPPGPPARLRELIRSGRAVLASDSHDVTVAIPLMTEVRA